MSLGREATALHDAVPIRSEAGVSTGVESTMKTKHLVVALGVRVTLHHGWMLMWCIVKMYIKCIPAVDLVD